MAHSTPGLSSFGAFPKRALWLMLSCAEGSMKARARVRIAAAESGMESAGVMQFAQKQSQSSSFRSRFYRRGICLLPAAEQQIPRATSPRCGMIMLWGFVEITALRNLLEAGIEKRELK
jgi:hypothetical protein